MKVSKRIEKIASLLDNINVIDIGCDHALLDVYLHKKGYNCIACDVNENALKFAKNNIEKYKINIPIVLSDGFKNVEIKPNTTAVISGMGTKTIIKIISNSKSENISNFIIQSNNDHKELRKFMNDKGYVIVDELGFIDQDKRYTVIKFQKGNKKYNKKQLQLGPCLIKKNDIDTKKYFLSILKENKNNLKKIPLKKFKKRIEIIKINHILKELI